MLVCNSLQVIVEAVKWLSHFDCCESDGMVESVAKTTVLKFILL